MAQMYIPSKDSMEMLQSLMQGFLLDIDSNGTVALLLKVEPSICTRISREDYKFQQKFGGLNFNIENLLLDLNNLIFSF